MASGDETALKLEILVEAACRYGLVMDLLTVIHEMHNGHPLDESDSHLLNSASIAALLAKAERVNQGIDRE